MNDDVMRHGEVYYEMRHQQDEGRGDRRWTKRGGVKHSSEDEGVDEEEYEREDERVDVGMDEGVDGRVDGREGAGIDTLVVVISSK